MKLKTIFKIVFTIVITIVILNFIPVKFAVDEDNINKYNINKYKYMKTMDNVYICLEDCEGLYALYNIKNNQETNAVRLWGNSPYSVLGYSFEETNNVNFFKQKFNYIVTDGYAVPLPPITNNTYIIQAKAITVNGEYEKEYGTYVYDVKKWDIVYPISRNDFRKYISPKSYLNIYDFNMYYILFLFVKNYWYIIPLFVIFDAFRLGLFMKINNYIMSKNKKLHKK